MLTSGVKLYFPAASESHHLKEIFDGMQAAFSRKSMISSTGLPFVIYILVVQTQTAGLR